MKLLSTVSLYLCKFVGWRSFKCPPPPLKAGGLEQQKVVTLVHIIVSCNQGGRKWSLPACTLALTASSYPCIYFSLSGGRDKLKKKKMVMIVLYFQPVL